MTGGGYSEYASVPAVQCLPVPTVVRLIDAAGLPETFCTVWTNVFDRMHLQSGETFLVQGGSSGIGITTIQLAKAFGSNVLATAGSDVKCQACRAFADVAINYRTQDFVAVGKAFTGGRGVGAIHRKHLTVTSSTLRGRSVAQKAAIITALRELVWPLWDQGNLCGRSGTRESCGPPPIGVSRCARPPTHTG